MLPGSILFLFKTTKSAAKKKKNPLRTIGTKLNKEKPTKNQVIDASPKTLRESTIPVNKP